MMLFFELSEVQRQLTQLIRIGTIADTDYTKARVRVKSGDLLSGWLPWLTARASHNTNWDAPEIGEQVLILSPDGDMAQAVIVGSIYQQSHPAIDDTPEHTATVFKDKALFRYDRDQHELLIDIPSTGKATLTTDTGTIDVFNDDGMATVRVLRGDIKVLADEGHITVQSTDGQIDVVADNGAIKVQSDNGTIDVLTGTGTVNIVAQGGISIEGDVSITGSLTTTGEITDHTRSMQADRELYNSHTHGGGSTPSPQQ